MEKKCVLLCSGGMDSTVLLWQLVAEGYQILPLGVDYGQKHRKELEAARIICKKIGLELQVADLTSITKLLSGSSLISDGIDVPSGHYTDESMKSTIVPNRNMLMLSIASAWAISGKAKMVAYAAHAGDHAIYPDCRPEFVSALSQAIALCDWHTVDLHAPFLRMSKGEICELGISLDAPLGETWSCYRGAEKHCGRCGTCIERKEAFSKAAVVDPTS